MNLRAVDLDLIHFFRLVSLPAARAGLFVVFFWFGLLKVVGQSPASPLVEQLFHRTISDVPFDAFMVFFGVLECLIGALFLVRGAEQVVIPVLFVLHRAAACSSAAGGVERLSRSDARGAVHHQKRADYRRRGERCRPPTPAPEAEHAARSAYWTDRR